MRRGILLALVLCCVALSGPSHDDVRFLLPIRPIVLAGPRGTDVQYQAWVKRHPANRFVQIEVWDGETKIKSDGWDIDGDSPQIQPTYRALLVRLGPGRYTFRALACTSADEGQCAKVRASAVLQFRVCGESCD
jgi:hypothetical protein